MLSGQLGGRTGPLVCGVRHLPKELVRHRGNDAAAFFEVPLWGIAGPKERRLREPPATAAWGGGRFNCMVQSAKPYIPDPRLVEMLAASGETLFQFVCRHAALLKARESELGAHPGDGPASDQIDSLLAALRPVLETPDPHPPDAVWRAFAAAVQVRLSWLFPERDPVAEPMSAGLREVENTTAWALDQAAPETAKDRQTFVDLAVVANAAGRVEKLGPIRRLWSTLLIALARLLWWLGGGERHR